MHFRMWLENDLSSFLSDSTVKYPVYHGTNNNFNQFSYQKSYRTVLFSQFEVEAKGFFFSESPHDALEFGKNIAECYVRLTNPLLDPRRDPHLGIDRLPYKKEMDLMKILAPLIYKVKEAPYNGSPYIDIGVGRYFIRPGREWIYNAVKTQGIEWDVLDNPQVIDRMKKLGYDGTFVAEPSSYLGRSIFVINPDQVRIIKWIQGGQPDWGDKDDYYTRKINGLDQLFPKPKEFLPPETSV